MGGLTAIQDKAVVSLLGGIDLFHVIPSALIAAITAPTTPTLTK